MSTLVIDLSHHNVIPENLTAAWDFGVRGLIHKATEGTWHTDDKLEARHSMVRSSPILWGVYHFLRPGDMEAQAKYFLDKTRHYSDENTLFAADYEDAGVSLDDLYTFLKVLEIKTRRLPLLYSGHVLKEKMADKPLQELTRYRLWLAQYSDKPVLPFGWGEYWLWQYTENGEVPGITPPTDLNRFDYSEEDLWDEWSGKDRYLEPPIPHKPKIVRVIAPKGVEVVVEKE